MATTTKTPAKTTPAKAAAPAKKAPAKKAAPKVAVPAARKLRWTLAEPKNGKPVEQHAESEGHEYRIERNGDQWRATHTYDGTKTVLVELGSFGKCYNAITKHNRSRA